MFGNSQIDAIGTAFEGFLGWNYYVGGLRSRVGLYRQWWLCSSRLVRCLPSLFDGLGLNRFARVWSACDRAALIRRYARIRTQDPQLLSLWGPEGQSWNSFFTILPFPGNRAWFPGFASNICAISLHAIGEGNSPGTIVAVIWTLMATLGAVLVGIVGKALSCRLRIP